MASSVISVTGSATTAVVAARSGVRIQVINYTIVSSAGGTFTWKSATTAISGDMVFGATGGASSSQAKRFLMQTEAGEALNLTHTAAAGGHIEWEYV
jgi:hypothetical protein